MSYQDYINLKNELKKASQERAFDYNIDKIRKDFAVVGIDVQKSGIQYFIQEITLPAW